MFASIQTDFAQALLDPDRAVPNELISHTARHPQKRFAVYRNNVVVSLVNALRAKFPATSRIVGDDFFAAMAHAFVSAHPPRSKILHIYGDDFGDFIAAFEPAAGLPYLADVAHLEAARTRAYHAADAQPLTPEAFANIEPQSVGMLRLTLHPSLQVLRSAHPVVTIWAMNADEMELGPVDLYAAEDALVLRPELAVTVRALPPGGAAFLLALSSGATLADAAADAASDDARFDLTANLAALIGSGAVIATAPARSSSEGSAS
jgi:hypothetical protein